ncbi:MULTISPECIES: aggregation-promoting factor C-terminal-like domain-containing protein [Streptomyces]|uniref:Transglycosylase SLT domain-containing protein n=1 Tax=Streptomyces arboris TaxID=2600619 RepID=A0A5N5EVJ2_9ACTN|nr:MULTISPECIES: transglycosylase SLT domain-containing protein [Streptomyces]KAB2592792.1 transglycosylase SLT domain-containing protein [Streptomyces arboris]MBT2376256.1 transglycosylase SLT domain-containing protein [Streptomyces sp. ISL-111]MBT2429782.1 transglycosylase SLT domain-containing protein [Streptomyces sp. ISL-112]MBT2464248.1 transglycosylase SLT domain-containing protein [Streptomyces sp. ISL-63]MDX3377264.1 transglycosylase SLT domain-containing protein [Streptomyces sp. ME0
MSRISVRGFAVASATAVTTVGAVVGVAAGGAPAADDNNFEAAAADTTLLADIPAGQQAQVQTASLTQQADAQASAADSAAKKSAEESARLQAAKDAKSKKAAAEAKAEAERQAAEKAKKEKEEAERASRSSVRDASSFSAQGSYTVAQVQAMARQMVPADQFQCFSNIVNHESTWNYRATNPSSGAYGLMQALPGHKMSSAGADWQTNPATQIKWGLSYMDSRYGSPCGAWSFWQANNWY